MSEGEFRKGEGDRRREECNRRGERMLDTRGGGGGQGERRKKQEESGGGGDYLIFLPHLADVVATANLYFLLAIFKN